MRFLNLVEKIAAALGKKKHFSSAAKGDFLTAVPMAAFFFCNRRKIDVTLANDCFPADRWDFWGLENDKQAESCVFLNGLATASLILGFLQQQSGSKIKENRE